MKKQSSNSRLDESLGERRGKESSKSQSYASRRDESRAMSGTKYSSMISEDRSAPANLPQSVVHKPYPRCEYLSYEINDKMSGLDEDRRFDIGKVRSQKPNSKY